MPCAARLAAVLVLAWASVAAADVAPDPLATGGTTLIPRGKVSNVWGPTGEKAAPDVTTAVRMMWEEVDLYPSTEKNAVTAVFCFKNLTDKDVAMEVGFPDYSDTRLQDFAVEIDGRKQAAEVKKDEPAGPKKIFKAWLCWNMQFPAGKEQIVKVSYWMKTGRAFRQLYHDKLPDDLKAKLLPYTSGYVLRTGAGWAGTIGKAVIRMHYGDAVRKPLVTSLAPKKGWQFDAAANVDTLTLNDFEPNSEADVAYTFALCTPAEEVGLLDAALRQKQLDPWAQERLLNLVEKQDVLKLPADQRSAKAVEILEWMVQPQGPAVDQTKISAGAEAVVQKAYQRLLKHYRDGGQAEKVAALAGNYEKFLKGILDRLEPFRSKGGYAAGQYNKVEKERKEILALIGPVAAK